MYAVLMWAVLRGWFTAARRLTYCCLHVPDDCSACGGSSSLSAEGSGAAGTAASLPADALPSAAGTAAAAVPSAAAPGSTAAAANAGSCTSAADWLPSGAAGAACRPAGCCSWPSIAAAACWCTPGSCAAGGCCASPPAAGPAPAPAAAAAVGLATPSLECLGGCGSSRGARVASSMPGLRPEEIMCTRLKVRSHRLRPDASCSAGSAAGTAQVRTRTTPPLGRVSQQGRPHCAGSSAAH